MGSGCLFCGNVPLPVSSLPGVSIPIYFDSNERFVAFYHELGAWTQREGALESKQASHSPTSFQDVCGRASLIIIVIIINIIHNNNNNNNNKTYIPGQVAPDISFHRGVISCHCLRVFFPMRASFTSYFGA